MFSKRIVRCTQMTVFVIIAQITVCDTDTALGSFGKPFDCLGVVLLHVVALVVIDAHSKLRVDVSAFGSGKAELHGTGIVLLHAGSVVIADGKIKLCIGKFVFSGKRNQTDRLAKVLLYQLATEIDRPQLVGSTGVPKIDCASQESNSFLFVLIDPRSVKITQCQTVGCLDVSFLQCLAIPLDRFTVELCFIETVGSQ